MSTYVRSTLYTAEDFPVPRRLSRNICGSEEDCSRLQPVMNHLPLPFSTLTGSVIHHRRRTFPSFGGHGLRQKCVMCHMPLQTGRGQIAARRRIWQTRAGDLGLADKCNDGRHGSINTFVRICAWHLVTTCCGCLGFSVGVTWPARAPIQHANRRVAPAVRTRRTVMRLATMDEAAVPSRAGLGGCIRGQVLPGSESVC